MEAVRGGRRRGGGPAAPPDRRREKRRELDARRSRCRIRLGGGHLERWCRLKEQLGFALHSQLAQFLLDRYNGCGRSSGDLDLEVLPAAALQRLVVLSHGHGQECGFVPDVKAPAPGAASHLVWECVAGHTFSWGVPEVTTTDHHREEVAGRRRSLRQAARSPGGDAEVEGDDGEEGPPAEAEDAGRPLGPQEEVEEPGGEDDEEDEELAEEDDDDDLAYADDLRDETYHPALDSDSEPQRRQNHPKARKKPVKEEEPPQEPVSNPAEEKMGRVSSKRRPHDDDVAQIGPKRIRKAAKREILLCDFEGCGKIFSNRQYLNHHKKYQHVHQKTFTCSEPSCGKSFNFKKHLKEHEKLHSDKRDYICEFCARSFRTSSNLIIHRRIHTGEKPLQCEICGFTCRQKASLNWHMKKHAADTFYRFSCDLCGKKFEKKDNVAAHKSKSHPETPGTAPHDENPEGSAAEPGETAALGVAPEGGGRQEKTPPGEEGGAGRAAEAENA